MPTSMSGGDGGGGGRGSTGLGVAGREDPSRKTKKKPNRPTDRGFRGNPAVTGGNPITPYVPSGRGVNDTQMNNVLDYYAQSGNALGGTGGAPPAGGLGAGSGSTPQLPGAPTTWGGTYSPEDFLRMESDPYVILAEMLSAQGNNNPTQMARHGNLPEVFAALAPYLNGALTGDLGASPGASADTVAGFLSQYQTPGAGGVDVMALLNQILNPGAATPGNFSQEGMTNLAAMPSEELNKMINMALALASPIMAPFIARGIGARQDQFGQANLDANGGQDMGPYGQWLLGQGM